MNASNKPSRLLNQKEAASYLGVSRFTINDLLKDGILHKITLPLAQRAVRKVLIDRLELDQLIEQSKM